MSEKRTISGVRTDISPSEFGARLKKVENKSEKRSENFKTGFKKVNYILSALGLMPMLTNDSGSRGRRDHGHVSDHHHSSNSFKQSYRVDPPRRTHEDMVREHIAHDAYMDMVDGKGDNER